MQKYPSKKKQFIHMAFLATSFIVIIYINSKLHSICVVVLVLYFRESVLVS